MTTLKLVLPTLAELATLADNATDPITALAKLAALEDRLAARKGELIERARDEGASFPAIGRALGVSGQAVHAQVKRRAQRASPSAPTSIQKRGSDRAQPRRKATPAASPKRRWSPPWLVGLASRIATVFRGLSRSSRRLLAFEVRWQFSVAARGGDRPEPHSGP